MAEEPKGKESPSTAEKKPSRMWLWIVIALLAVGGIGAGAFLLIMKKGPTESTAAATPKETAAQEKQNGGSTGSSSGVIFDLDPFVVNLADQQEIRYLKVTIKLELDQPTYKQEVENHLPQIRDSLLVLLSSKDYASIRTVEGKMDLRVEIIHRINTVLQGDKVKGVYFTEFVAQ